MYAATMTREDGGGYPVTIEATNDDGAKKCAETILRAAGDGWTVTLKAPDGRRVGVKNFKGLWE